MDTPPDQPAPPSSNGLPNDRVHQARQVLAGVLGLAVACFDRWHYPQPELGFSTNIDELLLLVSLGLIAGAMNIFRGPGPPPPPPESKP